MLTDDELDSIYEKHKHAGEEGWEYDHDAIARAAIAAYQAKLLAGVEMPEPMYQTHPLNRPDAYSEGQMEEYAAACAAQAREKALEDAERAVRQRWPNTRYAAAIEQLKGGE